MRIGVLGTGRMGSILAARFAVGHDVSLYDADAASANAAAKSLGLKSSASLAELEAEAVVLAVPDSAVASCLEKMRELKKNWQVFSVATNISREMLGKLSDGKLRSLNVKVIGHAGEMSGDARPVIVIDQGESDMVETAQKIFSLVGDVVVGDADQVKQINVIATEEALKAAVAIEQALCSAGVTNPGMVKSALAQVAPGVLKAFAADDLGPFARGIIAALRDKSDRKMV